MPESCRKQSSSVSRRSMKKDRKSTRLNSSHLGISYAVFCLKKKKIKATPRSDCPIDLHPHRWRLGNRHEIALAQHTSVAQHRHTSLKKTQCHRRLSSTERHD